MTDLQIFCLFKLVRFGCNQQNLALYMSWFHLDGPKYKVPDFQIAKFVDLQALDPKCLLALKAKVLELDGSNSD